MRSRMVRVTLTLLAVGAIAAAAYFTWATESRAAEARHASVAFENARMAALREAFELRASQQAYVAAGQNEDFWFGKVTASVGSLKTTLAALTASTSSSTVRAALEAANQALQDFEQVDRRARTSVSNDQKLLASDMIFSDGLDTAGRITAALEQAGHVAVQESLAAASAARREQLIPLAGAVAGVIVALLLLTGVPHQASAAAPAPSDMPMHAAPNADGLDLTAVLREEPRPVAALAPAVAASPLEIEGLAALCTDLARLSDTSALPALLERAAATLDASGLVLWVVDPSGNELVPAAAHGYPATVLARLGSLKVDAENATAAAFRTGLVQTVRADEMSHGAIAAPLVSASGCRGVMSAEVRKDGETHPAKLAAASIVAAQLATLVGPPAVPAQDRNTAAM